MEIERKFLVEELPAGISTYRCLVMEQAYLCTNPVIRIRSERIGTNALGYNASYYLTYKGKGLLAREEYNLPLNEEAYEHLLNKVDGNIINKKRYLIPIMEPTFACGYTAPKQPFDLKIELDIFDPPFAPLMIAEVEFPDENMANAFIPPAWLGEDVTFNSEYHNSTLSKKQL